VSDATLLQLSIDFTAPMHEQHIIGAEGAIDDQLAAPMAIRLLLPQKIFLRAADGLRDAGVVCGI